MKPKTFNLTPKRIQALRFIQAHPGSLVGYVAENVLPRISHGANALSYTAQGATRAGAGYCIALQKQGLVSIETYRVRAGYGRVSITAEGIAELKAVDRREESQQAARIRAEIGGYL